jgi:hypothetical protein
MANQFKTGEVVPQSGIYRIDHRPPHSKMPEEITLVRGRWFPDCPVCHEIIFELVHPAADVRQVEPLEEVAGSPEE